MPKTILVTGAAGFIGSHLCEALLRSDHKVVGIDNFDLFYSRREKEVNLHISKQDPNFLFIEGNAGDVQLLNRIPEKVDVVVHLAAKAGVLPSLNNAPGYIEANIGVTNSILEWMREKAINKLVFASSSSVYGNNTKIPFEEKDIVNEPISPYAFTKRSCEIMNYTYHSLYGFDIINLRFFTVYGERQRPDLAIRKFVDRIYSGKPITVYGDGRTARDYTYYSDTVSGIVSAVNYVCTHSKVWDIINLGNNNPVKLIDLIHSIASATGIEPLLGYEQMKPGDVNITYANIDRGKQILNYHPKVPLQTGIENFVRWYKQVLSEASFS